jgi:outer membrane receptor protein involved in Fe transport
MPPIPTPARRTGVLLAFLAAAVPAFAQSVSPSSALSAPLAKPATETLILSPFEVTAGSDRGYAASTAMSGTRTNEKLENLPNAISVMTADLLADLGAVSYFDAVDYGVSSENVYTDTGTRGGSNGNRSGSQVSFRGLASIRQLRDGFPWYVAQDIFNTERIEFSRGPGGLSYGDVDAGGTVNISTKRASLTTKRSTVNLRWDDFGGRRISADEEIPLLPKKVGLRLNAVYGDGEGWRQRTGQDIKGIAAALRVQLLPKTAFDLTYEAATQRDMQSHVVLTD